MLREGGGGWRIGPRPGASAPLGREEELREWTLSLPLPWCGFGAACVCVSVHPPLIIIIFFLPPPALSISQTSGAGRCRHLDGWTGEA